MLRTIIYSQKLSVNSLKLTIFDNININGIKHDLYIYYVYIKVDRLFVIQDSVIDVIDNHQNMT